MTQHVHKAQVTGWVGWIAAAAFLILFAGILHIVFGFAAIMSQGWYLTGTGTAYLLNTEQWGWTLIIGGALMIMSAMLLYMGSMAGRIIAGIIVVGSIFANIAVFSLTPIWSTLAIVVDIVILYAIIAHGSEMKNLDEADM